MFEWDKASSCLIIYHDHKHTLVTTKQYTEERAFVFGFNLQKHDTHQCRDYPGRSTREDLVSRVCA